MLTFLLGVGATAGLGLIALKVPAVSRALDKFALWAGLFMQIAGVLEALRRLAHSPRGVFSIVPAAPVVSLAGGAVGTAPKAPAGTNVLTGKRHSISLSATVDDDEPVVASPEEAILAQPMEFAPRHVNQNPAEVDSTLDDIDTMLKTSNYLGDREFGRQVQQFTLAPVLYWREDGTRDLEAIMDDPRAERAYKQWLAIDDLISDAQPLSPVPTGASVGDTSIYQHGDVQRMLAAFREGNY